MSINIAKANQGEFYPFKLNIKANNDILSDVLATFDSDIQVEGTYVVETMFTLIANFLIQLSLSVQDVWTMLKKIFA